MRTITLEDLKTVSNGACKQELEHKVHLLIKRGVVVTDKRRIVKDVWMDPPWGCDMHGCKRKAMWWDRPYRWCDECARICEPKNYDRLPEYTGQS